MDQQLYYFKNMPYLFAQNWLMCKNRSPICLFCLPPQISTLKNPAISSLSAIVLPYRIIHVLIQSQIQKQPKLTPDLVIEMNYCSLTYEHI